MTMKEALDRRIPRIRKANWADPNAYVRLPLFKDGKFGPWAELYSEYEQRDVLEIRPGSQRFLTLGSLDDDGYERYAGPASEFESHHDNFARTYEEA